MTKRANAVGEFYSQFRGNTARERKALLSTMYVRILTELCANRFKWSGMPKTVDTRFLELQLFRRALAVFYFDRDYQRFMAVSGTPGGRLNEYHNPTEFTVTTPIFSKKVKASPYPHMNPDGTPLLDEAGMPVFHVADCVPIWANYLRQPDWDVVQIYAARLAELDRTIDINIGNMRKPFLIACDENERQSMVNIYRQIAEGQPVIFGTETMGDAIGNKVQVFDMKVHEQTLINLMIAKSRAWNECMTLLGIDNSNQDKKERLVASEVDANNDQIMSMRMVALNSRKEAATLINEIWNLNVSVEWNTDQKDIDGPPMIMGLPAPNDIDYSSGQEED